MSQRYRLFNALNALVKLSTISTILEFYSITNIHYLAPMFAISVYIVFPLFILEDLDSPRKFEKARPSPKRQRAFAEKIEIFESKCKATVKHSL